MNPRLAAVAAGAALLLAACSGSDDDTTTTEPPPETAAPVAATSPDETPQPAPLDGGTYTWASGVAMTVHARDVLQPADYCAAAGDYCGSFDEPAKPVVVIDYEISVPADYGQRFEASGCLGLESLHPMNPQGDAPAGVWYGFDRPVESVGPGMSKRGTVEYEIDPSTVGAEFYLESSCGDASGDEWGSFVGVLS